MDGKKCGWQYPSFSGNPHYFYYLATTSCRPCPRSAVAFYRKNSPYIFMSISACINNHNLIKHTKAIINWGLFFSFLILFSLKLHACQILCRKEKTWSMTWQTSRVCVPHTHTHTPHVYVWPDEACSCEKVIKDWQSHPGGHLNGSTEFPHQHAVKQEHSETSSVCVCLLTGSALRWRKIKVRFQTRQHENVLAVSPSLRLSRHVFFSFCFSLIRSRWNDIL